MKRRNDEWNAIKDGKDKVWDQIEKEIKLQESYFIFSGKGDSLRYDFTQNSGENFILAVLQDLEAISGRQDLVKLWQNRQIMFPVFMAKCRNYTFMTDNVMFSLRMPGLLLNTNANTIAGNVCMWEVPETVQWINFEMIAESRLINTWAFLITGVLILLLLILFVGRILH